MELGKVGEAEEEGGGEEDKRAMDDEKKIQEGSRLDHMIRLNQMEMDLQITMATATGLRKVKGLGEEERCPLLPHTLSWNVLGYLGLSHALINHRIPLLLALDVMTALEYLEYPSSQALECPCLVSQTFYRFTTPGLKRGSGEFRQVFVGISLNVGEANQIAGFPSRRGGGEGVTRI